MIAYMKGVIAWKGAEGIELEVGGVGYELTMSSQALSQLPPAGSTAQVWTYLQVKEDGLSLYGFASLKEKELFERLIGVSGIGAKTAISALSSMKSDELASAISRGDVDLIDSIPGVGKKTAQRLVLELQGVLKTEPDLFGAASAEQGEAMSDAAQALQSMGFSAQEVASALKGCTAGDASSIVRYALKNLGGM